MMHPTRAASNLALRCCPFLLSTLLLFVGIMPVTQRTVEAASDRFKLASLPPAWTIPAKAQSIAPRRAGELIVRFRENIAEHVKNAAVGGRGARRGRQLRGESGFEMVELPGGHDPLAVAAELRFDPAVEIAEPNFLITRADANPDDPRFDEQWALQNRGQSGGLPGSDIGVAPAWRNVTVSPSTVIAVIDSGVDFTHPDLRDYRWMNRLETADKEDNDGDGFVDDLGGWDWVRDSKVVKDEHGHGTTVAGIIAATSNQWQGLAGAHWQPRLMSLRVLNASGQGTIADAVEAIDYAVAHGAQVINCSWGTDGSSVALRDAMTRAASKNVVIVCASGNGGRDIDDAPHFPASYDLPFMLSVASTDNSDTLASWSNWGARSVAVAAAGEEILTTRMGGGYESVSGTSASAAIVSGVAGLIKSQRPRLSVERTRAVIIGHVRKVNALQGKVSAGGIVDAAGTLNGLNFLSQGEGLDGADDDGAVGSGEEHNSGGRDGQASSKTGGQDSNEMSRPAPIITAPAANLPNLDQARRLQSHRPQTPPPIPSTRRRCARQNPRCNETPFDLPRPLPTPAPLATPSPRPLPSPRAQTTKSESFLASLTLQSFLIPTTLAFGGGRPLYHIPALDFLNGDSGYRVSDLSVSSGIASPPALSLAAMMMNAAPQSGGAPTAFFINTAATTQGNWKGAYGAEGSGVVSDSASYPAYAQVTTSGQSLHTWAASTGDVRALQKASSSTDRIAAAWWSTTDFNIEVNLTDGIPHRVALYCLDWDNNGRSQTVDVLDAATNTLLDRRTVAAFTNGKYLVWKLSGHVRIKVTNSAGTTTNAVVSGLFFDPERVNVALAANGSVARASSVYENGFEAGGVINGDRRGSNWGGGGGWGDASPSNTFPDWVEVDFNGSKTIHEIDVFTGQDSPFSPSEPTGAMTFSLYGLTGYSVQYWNGSNWVNVPGGSVTGNNKVWRKFTFAPLATTKVRVLTNASVDGFSRITEVEAWGTSTPLNRPNVALASNGGIATASTQYNLNFPPDAAINGDRFRLYQPDGRFNIWHSAAGASKPDWLQVDFGSPKTIGEIDVVTQQDNYNNPVDPSGSTTFSLYGLTAYEVQYWDGTGWVTVPGGSVTGNNLVRRKFTFPEVTTLKIRVLISASTDGFSRIMELEAYQTGGAPSQGTGLTARYYDNLDFTGYKLTRNDSTVNFDWGSGAPASGVGADQFSVRWTGMVEPRYSEAYTFYTLSDDGVRLWVDGQLVVNNWTDHGLTENSSAPIALVAGRQYDIKMEFYDNWSGAIAKLSWASTSQSKEIVPQNRLYGCWKGTDQFVRDFYQGALRRQPNISELQQWSDRLVQAQGDAQLMAEAQALGQTLFTSQEYTNRNPSDNGVFLYDIYWGFLQRAPDNNGLTFWTAQVGAHGRNFVREQFAASGEFTEKVRRLCGTSATAPGNGETGYNFSTAQLDPSNRTGQSGVDLLSRNHNWSLPLVSLSGRAGLDLGLALSYNSLVWTKDGSGITFDAARGFPGPGFRLGFPVIHSRFYNPHVQQPGQPARYSYLLVTPSGGRVELRQVGASNVYESADSSYLQLTDNGGGLLTLLSPDGTRLSFSLTNGEYQCYEIKDRNGNFITVNYDGYGQISTVIDTLGRTVTFNYDSFQNLISITQPWKRETPAGTVNETHTWATFGYTDITLQPNFTNLAVLGAQSGTTIPALMQVGLADGSYYKFSYTEWGQVYKITHYAADSVPGQDLHPLSYTLYDLPGSTLAASSPQTDCPRVTERRDWIENGVLNQSAEVTTSYNEWSPNMAEGMATMPDGTTVYKEMYHTSGYKKGLPHRTETLSGGALKKWTTYSWKQDDESGGYQINPRVEETNVYDSDGNRRRATVAYTSSNLPREVKEYAANASTVIRRTETDYKLDPVADAAYLNRRMIGLARERRVYDENGALVAKIGYVYDDPDATFRESLPSAPVQHDGAGYGTNFVQGRGNLNRVRRYDVTGNAASHVENKVGYNITGSVVFTKDALDHPTTISYADSFFDGINRNTFAYPTTVTDPNGYSSTSRYNYGMGVAVFVQTPKTNTTSNVAGSTQQMLFDAAGRIEKVSRRETELGPERGYTRWIYPTHMRLAQSYTLLDVENGVNKESYSATLLDGVGRENGRVRLLPSAGANRYSAQMVKFDVMGRVVEISNPAETDGNWTIQGDDLPANGGTGWVYTKQAYDWQGRPTVTTNVDTTKKEIVYDGCGCTGGAVVTVRDEKGRQRRITTNEPSRTVKTEELELDGVSVYRTVTDTYNARNQIIRTFDQQGVSGAGQETLMSYDGHGRLETSKTPIQSSPTIYTYNADDTVNTVTDARSVVIAYGYNERHLVSSVTYSVPANATPAITPTAPVTFEYDAAGNRTLMQDGMGKVDYVYDMLSRLTSETRTFNGITARTYALGYDYTSDDSIKKVTDPFGATLNYIYDPAGQLTSVTGTGYEGVSQFVSQIKYRAWGDVKSMTYGNNRTQSALYNVRLQTSRIEMPGIMWASYQYDPDGRVKLIDHDFSPVPNDLDPDLPRLYDYDQVGRLKSVNFGPASRPNWQPDPNCQFCPDYTNFKENFDYDVFGNMTSRFNDVGGDSVFFIASYVNGRVASYFNGRTPNPAWQYDAAGNLTQTDTRKFTYDAASRQSHVSDLNLSLFYDGDGQQAKKTQSDSQQSVTTYYLRSSVLDGRVLAELNQFGDKKYGYVYADDELIAEHNPSGQNLPDHVFEPFGQTRVWWIHRDPASTFVWRTNSSGSVTSQEHYDPLGGIIDFHYQAVNQTFQYLSVLNFFNPYLGNTHNPGLGCNLDGVASPCSSALQMVNNGSAAVCPNNNCGPRATSGGFVFLNFTADGFLWGPLNPYFSAGDTGSGETVAPYLRNGSGLPHGDPGKVQRKRRVGKRRPNIEQPERSKREQPTKPLLPNPITNTDVRSKIVGSGDVPKSIIDSIVAISNSEKCAEAFRKWLLRSPGDVVRLNDFKLSGRGTLSNANAAQVLGWSQSQVNEATATFNKENGWLGIFFVKYTADYSYQGIHTVVFNAYVVNKHSNLFGGPRDITTHAFIHLGGQPGNPNAEGHDLSRFAGYNEILEACR